MELYRLISLRKGLPSPIQRLLIQIRREKRRGEGRGEEREREEARGGEGRRK